MHAAAADSPLLKAFHRAGDEIVREPQFFICEGPEMLDILGELLQNSQRNEESDDQTEVFHDFPSFSMTFSESSPMFTVHLTSAQMANGTLGNWWRTWAICLRIWPLWGIWNSVMILSEIN